MIWKCITLDLILRRIILKQTCNFSHPKHNTKIHWRSLFSLGGGFYFQEFYGLKLHQYFLFALGISIVVCGVFALAPKHPTDDQRSRANKLPVSQMSKIQVYNLNDDDAYRNSSSSFLQWLYGKDKMSPRRVVDSRLTNSQFLKVGNDARDTGLEKGLAGNRREVCSFSSVETEISAESQCLR